MVIHTYERSQTFNNKVNYQKLDLEIRASTIENYVTPCYEFKGLICVEFSANPTAEHLTMLDGIVGAHDGEEAAVSEAQVNARELKIREMTEMAILHPLLNNNDVAEYLHSIDNGFNAWKRSGLDSALVTKIATDGANTSHPQFAFLDTTVNEAGNKTWEFLIGSVQS